MLEKLHEELLLKQRLICGNSGVRFFVQPQLSWSVSHSVLFVFGRMAEAEWTAVIRIVYIGAFR